MFLTTLSLRRLSASQTGPSCTLLPRTIHGSGTARRRRDPSNPVSHGAENYFVNGDDTPPPNNPVYRVDATSDAAQSAYESPSGPWSRASTETEEYRTVSKDKPYDVPGDPDTNLSYGGRMGYMDEKGPETSKAGEGPEGTERWGRKPEGRA